MNTAEKITRWKQKLLDLGKRNRLLFFKPTKRTTVKLVQPSYSDLFDRLVHQGQAWEFATRSPGRSALDIEPEEDAHPSNGSLPPIVLRPNQLLTDQNDSNLLKTLYQLRAKARTALDEQGANILYLAFGFLEWTESESSKDLIRSPLILVPVELQLESVLDPYTLAPFDDDIVVNPTLLHKLQIDFGISLPTLPDEEDWRLDGFLDEVQNIVSKNGWRVSCEAQLSLFSFFKLNMYKDMDRFSAEIASHPIVAAIAGDSSKLPPMPDDILTADELDRKQHPAETFQVLDADSSQQEAINAAKRGASFVLQGPPGTGKSQTITNMVAECLASGKRVLFVSEKMAALNVVFRRLQDNGLGDFCLQLHSHKANKKDVVEELGRTLYLAKSSLTERVDEKLAQLTEHRQALNAVVNALHADRLPLEMSVYQVHGEVAMLESAPDVIFPFERASQRTPAELSRYRQLLEQFASTATKVGADYLSNPWRGSVVTAFNLQLQHDIQTRFQSLQSLLARIPSVLAEPVASFGLNQPDTVADMEFDAEVLALAGKSPMPPVEWLTSTDLAPLAELARRYQDALSQYEHDRSALLAKYETGYLSTQPAPLAELLDSTAAYVATQYRPTYVANADELVTKRPTLVPLLSNALSKVQALLETGMQLASTLTLLAPRTVQEFEHLIQVADLVARDPRPQASWFDTNKLRQFTALAREAAQQARELAADEQNLFDRFDREVLSLEVTALLQRFRTDYTGFLRVFKPSYYRDMKALRSFYKAAAAMPYPQALTDLQVMKTILDRRAWLRERQQELTQAFGDWHTSVHTDWDGLISALDTVELIARHYRPEAVPGGLCSLLVRSGASIRQVALLMAQAQSALLDAIPLLDLIQEHVRPDHEPKPNSATSLNVPLESVIEWAATTEETLAQIYQAYDEVTVHAKRPPYPVEQLVANLRTLQRIQATETRLAAEHQQLRTHFGRFFQGLDTEWDTVLAALDWTSSLLHLFGNRPLPAPFAHRVATDAAAIQQAQATANEAGRLLETASDDIRFVTQLFEPYWVDLMRMPVPSAREWLTVRLTNLSALEDWLDFRTSRELCRDIGLRPFVDAVVEQQVPPQTIVRAFHKRFYRLWLDEVYEQAPELRLFRGRRHESRIQTFRELDREQFRIAQARLRVNLSALRPNPHAMTANKSEIAILARETEKRRKLLPLRKLFERISTLLLTLKPCLLMSPLSVSQFLHANLFKFDVVIFDEASQICSEDAIGAVFRGNQVVVVGDREQLPPSNFFATSIGDASFDDEDDDAEAYESILDECSSVLHRKSLKWHYRSRHEHLIAFSNAKIYRDLVTFPSPADKVPNQGVEFVHVPNGVYDRSGTRSNKVEAQRVAQLVFDHFRRYPKRSLGVVTFSEAQQSTIDAAVRQLRLTDSSLETFFSEDRDEPFFVKNLENVQGDERDTIIFSVCYAKDQAGLMHMNFGPLSRQGGHRRLNVAVTRAKHNVKLVSSMLPTDIDLERTSAEGVRMLRQYMEFAQQGLIALQRELTVSGELQFDSPFEEAVYRELRHHGFEVHTQVGCSGYRIDLAVRHPEHKGHFLLGIECDGRSYHSAKTARDRDRLREDVLRALGWRIHRIWSTDWIKDPRSEVARLLQSIEQAKEAGLPWEQPAAPSSPTAFELVYEQPVQPITKTPVARIASITESSDRLPGTVEYTEADIYDVPRGHNESDPVWASNVMAHIIGIEGPVHAEAVARRIAPLYGNKRVGATIKREVEHLNAHYAGGRFVARDDFYWPGDMQTAPVRVPSEFQKPRPIGEIAVEERAEAMVLILTNALGLGLDDLLVEAARLLGFNRTGIQIKEALQEAVEFLITAKRLEVVEGIARLVRGS